MNWEFFVISKISGNEYCTPDRANATVTALWEQATQKVAA